ncbi:hypothetical protein OSB04_022493 [Centaurea solstitialis]|uniref:Cytochrome P450 n=1 Tax=Centaurea solstitialis TaxID=347529 RepID=A0AA38WF77_9ASTR|nr:hypothetical protein OSB04_022493 [Centaurea solstitialis]
MALYFATPFLSHFNHNSQNDIKHHLVMVRPRSRITRFCYRKICYFMLQIRRKYKYHLSIAAGTSRVTRSGLPPFLGPNLHHEFTKLAQIYGPIFKLKLGSKTHIVISSPGLAEVVARELDDVFANRDPPAAALEISHGGKSIVWANNNALWRNMRKVFVYEVLSGKNLEASHVFRRAEVRKTVRRVYDAMGTEVVLWRVMFSWSLNVMTSMIWGKSSDGIGVEELREVLSRIVKLLGTANVSDFFPAMARLDLQGVVRDMKRQKTVLGGIFDRIINERMASKVEETIDQKGRRDFLQTLLELKEQNTTSSFTFTQIKTLFMDSIVGATDTTSTTVEWTMAELLQHPNIMKAVQNELEEVVGLNNIVEESHIPKLRGYTVPKGSNVYLNVWAIHRNPEYWENPLEFTPERFINPDGTTKFDFNGNNLKYFPFGSGRRKCPGIRLGEKMVVYVLASLLHSFNWSLPDGKELDLSDKFGIDLKKKERLIVIPSQRLADKNLYM